MYQFQHSMLAFEDTVSMGMQTTRILVLGDKNPCAGMSRGSLRRCARSVWINDDTSVGVNNSMVILDKCLKAGG